MVKRLLFVGGVTVSVVVVLVSPMRAGVIRDDKVSDSQYLALPNSPDYVPVGRLDGIVTGNSFTGSGTLITDRWVLTAAHVAAIGSGVLANPTSINVVFNVDSNNDEVDDTYMGAEWIPMPLWDANVGINGNDVGLVRLSASVTGVIPAQRYTGSAELGQIATIVGFGLTGTGSVGQQPYTQGTKHAGNNELDVLGSAAQHPNINLSANYLMADFDNPQSVSDSSFGSSAPVSLEYSSASGDSGGGVFINDGGVEKLAGVVSFGLQGPVSNPSQSLNFAMYGDLMGFTRVSIFNNWIDDQLSARYWNNTAGGGFGDGSNWEEGSAPGSGSLAVFNKTGTYTVSLAGDVNNKRIRVRKGDITLDLAGHTYTLSNTPLDRSIVVGQRTGDNTHLTFSGGGIVNAVDGSIGELYSTTGEYTGRLTVASGTVLNLSGSIGIGGSPTADGGNGTLTVEPGGSLQVAGAVKVWYGGTLDLNGIPSSFGSFDLSNGAITGSGDFTAANTSSWSTGTLSGTGKTNIPLGGVLNVNPSYYINMNGRTLENSGSINFIGTFYSLSLNNGTIKNLPDAVFNVSSETIDTNIYGGNGNAFDNAGTLNKSGSKSFYVKIPFNNSGTVNILDGRLSFDGNGGTHTGTFNIAAGATLDFGGNNGGGTHNLSAGANLTGAGNLVFGPAIVNLPASALQTTGPIALMPTGTLRITGSNSFNNFTWTGGTLTGSTGDKTTITNGATLNLNPSYYTYLTSRTLENAGTVNYNYSGYSLLLDNGAINNLNGGVFNVSSSISTSNSMLVSYSGTNIFNNAGIFNKTGTNTFRLTVPFANSGMVTVQAGTLRFDGSYTQSSPSSRITLNGGTFDKSGTLTIAAGSIEGNGTVAGNVQTHGTISPGQSAGTLTFGGNLTLFSDTQTAIEIGGLASGTEYDRLIVNGTATLGGTLDVDLINGFVPSAGQSFDILTAAGGIANNIVFATELLPSLSGGLLFDAIYLPTKISLYVDGVLGDYNHDRTVDAADYVVWRKMLGSITNLAADGSRNNIVDDADYGVWRANFGQTVGSGAGAIGSANAAVPEPTSLVLLILAASVIVPSRPTRSRIDSVLPLNPLLRIESA